jgi:hypothetical protein
MRKNKSSHYRHNIADMYQKSRENDDAPERDREKNMKTLSVFSLLKSNCIISIFFLNRMTSVQHMLQRKLLVGLLAHAGPPIYLFKYARRKKEIAGGSTKVKGSYTDH